MYAALFPGERVERPRIAAALSGGDAGGGGDPDNSVEDFSIKYM